MNLNYNQFIVSHISILVTRNDYVSIFTYRGGGKKLMYLIHIIKTLIDMTDTKISKYQLQLVPDLNQLENMNGLSHENGCNLAIANIISKKRIDYTHKNNNFVF